MISDRMKRMVSGGSAIRAMFEEGNRLASVYGRENVYDFSLGNPNFPSPPQVNTAIKSVLDEETETFVHGYMSNSGYPDVRLAIAQWLNNKYGTDYDVNSIIMTVGAAGGLNCMLQTLLNPGDEVLVFAPYFLEYGNYVANWGGALKVIPANPSTFQLSAEALDKAVSSLTKVLIINNPNNPSGVVYSEDTIKAIAAVLERKAQEYGHPIYILSDEPYRELAYDGINVPYIPNYYNNAVVVYSWSKSLSLPGERLGYIAIPKKANDAQLLFDAASISNRIIGFVNAPSLMQRAVARCLDCTTDVAAYDANRQLLYKTLTEYGFECTYPQGTFYLWVKTPVADTEFVATAKEQRILLVAGSSFACPGYVRIAYCVSKDQIERSLPAFKQLALRFGLC